MSLILVTCLLDFNISSTRQISKLHIKKYISERDVFWKDMQYFFFLNTDKKMQPVSQGILPFVLYILPWSSRNHSVMLICCSIHIYYYLISVENIFIRLQKYCVILRDFALTCETFVSSPKILCSPKKLCFLAEVLFSLETLLSLAKVLCARRSIVLLRNAAYS